MIRVSLVCLLTLALCCQLCCAVEKSTQRQDQTPEEFKRFLKQFSKNVCSPKWNCAINSWKPLPKEGNKESLNIGDLANDEYLDPLCTTRLPAAQQCADNADISVDCSHLSPYLVLTESICRHVEGVKAGQQCWRAMHEDTRNVEYCLLPGATTVMKEGLCKAIYSLRDCFLPILEDKAKCRREDLEIFKNIMSHLKDHACRRDQTYNY